MLENDKIENLKKKLYSRQHVNTVDERSSIPMSRKNENIDTWGNEVFHIEESEESPKSFINKFLIGSFIFLILSLLISSYFIFFRGAFSSKNVDIKVTGPSSVASGDDINLSLAVINGNNSSIESAVLEITFPKGAKSVFDGSDLKVMKRDLGRIERGQVLNISDALYFTIFGSKESIKTLNIKIGYRLSGSNAIFFKEKKYDIILDSSPAILKIDGPKEVNSNKEISFTTHITSNSPNLLKGLYLKVDYPYGFSYKDSTIKPQSGDNEWFLGDLKNGEKKDIEISGKITGQNEDEKTFRFSLSSKSEQNDDNDTLIAEFIHGLVIKKPFIDFSLTVPDAEDSGDFFVAKDLDSVSPIIELSNTLQNKIYNLKISSKVVSNYVNKSSFKLSLGGFYDSISGILSWDKNSTNSLSYVDPNDSRSISFSFGLLKIPGGVKNPEIMIESKVSATRDLEGGDTENITEDFSKTIRIQTNADLLTKTLFEGDIKNTGFIPPKAEKPTTYSLEWSIKNTVNDLKDVSVSTTLPANVSFTGVVYPSTENIFYDTETRQLIWKTSTVSYGSGTIFSPRKVLFQVKVIPSLNQVGQTIDLTGKILTKAKDSFTLKDISIENNPLTTKIYNSNEGGQVSR